MEASHEKYDELIARCKSIPPTPTAVAHPCDESSLKGAVDGARVGLITPILVGTGGADPRGRGRRQASTSRSSASSRPAQPGLRGEGGGAGPERRGRGADEGQPAHRRADGRGGRRARPACAPRGASATASSWTCRATRAADHHRRRGQHRSDAEGQGRHRPERDRPGAATSASTEVRVAILSAVETVNPEIPSTHRGGGAVQDGRPRPDHRRRCSTARWRSTTPSAPRRRRSRRSTRRSPGRPTSWWCRTSRPATCWPRAHLPRRRRCRWHRAGRAGADHPDQPRRLAASPGWPPAPWRPWSPTPGAASARRAVR